MDRPINISVSDLLSISIIVVAIFLVNFMLPSDLNGWSPRLNLSVSAITNDALLAEEVEWRYHNSEFGRRPLAVNLLRWGHAWTGWPYTIVFTTIQSIAYVITCLIILITARKLSPQASVANAVLPFCLLFPGIFLFVAHAHTFDDLFQYIFLSGVVFSLLSRKLYLASLCLVAACITRETSLLYVPAIIYLMVRWSITNLKCAVGIGALVTTVSMAAIALYSGEELIHETLAVNTSHRWLNFGVNFGTWQNFTETITLLLFIFAPFVYLCLRYLRPLLASGLRRDLLYAFVGVAVVNTVIVCIAAYAREARLLLLPILLILPVLSGTWSHATRKMLTYAKSSFTTVDALRMLLLSGLLVFFYQPTVGGTGYAFEAYGVVWTCFMYLLIRATLADQTIPRLPVE